MSTAPLKPNSGRAAVERIEESLERRNITFDALFRLFERIGTTLDRSTVVRLLLLTMMGQLKLKRVVCYLAISDSKRFELYHALGVGRRALPAALRGNTAFTRWISGIDAHRHIDSFLNEIPGAGAGETGRFLAALAERGFAYALPLTDGEESLGVLFYSGMATGEAFSDFDGELLRMLAKIASITIKNAALYQDAVRSKQEIEKFAKIKKDFIDHTSHELRTPLTVLKSALWSVEPEAAEEGILIDMAKDAVLRMQSKVEQLLSLNAVELNETSYELAPTDVSSLLEDCLREVIPELEEKQVTVAFDDRARYREVVVDGLKMKLVFRSIIDNAINFVERGGNISLVTELAEAAPGEEEGIEIVNTSEGWNPSPRGVPSRREDDETVPDRLPEDPADFRISSGAPYFVIRVADDGIGIPADEIQSIAEPFRRASNSPLHNVKGLGIGLSVSLKIIAGHGGRLFCRSGEGRGAQFSIWLPIG